MLEVEVKFRIRDVKGLVNRLRGFATHIGSNVEEDHYFNHPCRDFRSTDEAVRVRVYGSGRVTVTYKGPRLGVRVRLGLSITSTLTRRIT
ncbi:MAG: hypothetical protein AT709_07990 [Caldivirga sp. MG_3]|jgi:adenylate cyclase|nr:MAG: hypothetical protein AT709_07990 [Caldivirga sp. MG_3]